MQQKTVLITGAILLGLLMAHSRFCHPWLSLGKCMTNPEKYDQHIVTHFKEPRIGQIENNGFWLIEKHGSTIFVKMDTTGLIKNEYIGITAIYNKGSYLHPLRFTVAKRRRYKIFLSILPVILIFSILPRIFRIRLNPIRIEDRVDA